MPTVITHAFVGVAAGKIYAAQRMPRLFWDLTIVCALIPDLDVIAFRLGVPYGSMWGHRGITHSLFFALVIGLIAASLFRREEGIFSPRWWSSLLYFFLVTAINGVLDAFTDGGRGVAFFAPFSDARFFFPWRPLHVSPIGARYFFTPFGLRAIQSEILWIWLPLIVLVVTVGVVRIRFRYPRGNNSKK